MFLIHVIILSIDVFVVVEFDDYAEIVDDDPDYAHPMAGTNENFPVKRRTEFHFVLHGFVILSELQVMLDAW